MKSILWNRACDLYLHYISLIIQERFFIEVIITAVRQEAPARGRTLTANSSTAGLGSVEESAFSPTDWVQTWVSHCTTLVSFFFFFFFLCMNADGFSPGAGELLQGPVIHEWTVQTEHAIVEVQQEKRILSVNFIGAGCYSQTLSNASLSLAVHLQWVPQISAQFRSTRLTNGRCSTTLTQIYLSIYIMLLSATPLVHNHISLLWTNEGKKQGVTLCHERMYAQMQHGGTRFRCKRTRQVQQQHRHELGTRHHTTTFNNNLTRTVWGTEVYIYIPRTPGDTGEANDTDTGECDDTHYATQQEAQETDSPHTR